MGGKLWEMGLLGLFVCLLRGGGEGVLGLSFVIGFLYYYYRYCGALVGGCCGVYWRGLLNEWLID